MMEKGWEQIVAVLGIHFAGAAYLPIDPELPAERQRFLLEHAKVKVALTQSGVRNRLSVPASVEVFEVDQLKPADDGAPADRRRQKPEDLAYVIYTSGSTGVPKGVMIDHRGALNTVLDINQRFGVGPQDRDPGRFPAQLRSFGVRRVRIARGGWNRCDACRGSGLRRQSLG